MKLFQFIFIIGIAVFFNHSTLATEFDSLLDRAVSEKHSLGNKPGLQQNSIKTPQVKSGVQREPLKLQTAIQVLRSNPANGPQGSPGRKNDTTTVKTSPASGNVFTPSNNTTPQTTNKTVIKMRQ